MTVLQDPLSTIGLSNLGSFTLASDACIVFPPPTNTYDGTFSLDFSGGNTLFGTTGSLVAPSATPGVLDIEGAFFVQGGTGKFTGATGTFFENGTVDRRVPGIAVATTEFHGSLNLLPVPEPATWGLMLAGFAGVLATARRRQAEGGSPKV